MGKCQPDEQFPGAEDNGGYGGLRPGAEQNLSVNTTGYELILVTTTAGSAIMEYGDAAQIVIDYGAALTQRSVTWTNDHPHDHKYKRLHSDNNIWTNGW